MESKIINKLRGALLIIVAFLFAACSKKNVPEDIYGTPIFLFDGEIGSDKIDYKAGVNNLYMFSDYYKDNQEIYTLKGVLAKELCATCSPYLCFEFKDIEASFHSSLSSGVQFFFRDSVFKCYSKDSILVPQVEERFIFSTVQSNTAMSYLWDFGDGTTSTSPSPEHLYNTDGIKNVTLKTSLQGVEDSLTIPIDVTPMSTCRSQFSFVVDTFLKRVVVTTDNLSFANYQWDFGNGITGSGIIDSMIYSMPGIYKITLTSNIGGCVSNFVQKVNLTNTPFATMANFVYNTKTTQQMVMKERLNTKTCVITYHKDNKVYKSYKNIAGLDQSNKEIFRVRSVSNYDRNEKNKATLAITGDVDTYLYNQDNAMDSIRIKSNAIKIALAYPD